MKRILLLSISFAAVLAAVAARAEPEIAKYIGADPETFAEEQAAIDKFKAGLTAGDIPALSALLGLDPNQVGTSDGFEDRFKELQALSQAVRHVRLLGPRRRSGGRARRPRAHAPR